MNKWAILWVMWFGGFFMGLSVGMYIESESVIVEQSPKGE